MQSKAAEHEYEVSVGGWVMLQSRGACSGVVLQCMVDLNSSNTPKYPFKLCFAAETSCRDVAGAVCPPRQSVQASTSAGRGNTSSESYQVLCRRGWTLPAMHWRGSSSGGTSGPPCPWSSGRSCEPSSGVRCGQSSRHGHSRGAALPWHSPSMQGEVVYFLGIFWGWQAPGVAPHQARPLAGSGASLAEAQHPG